MYRVPNYLATAWAEKYTFHFITVAIDSGKPPVLWIIQLDKRGDPNGEDDPRYRVHNVNFISKQAAGLLDEGEFLFTAYSCFEVTNVEFQQHPTSLKPHKIYLKAHDNRAVG